MQSQPYSAFKALSLLVALWGIEPGSPMYKASALYNIYNPTIFYVEFFRKMSNTGSMCFLVMII